MSARGPRSSHSSVRTADHAERRGSDGCDADRQGGRWQSDNRSAVSPARSVSGPTPPSHHSSGKAGRDCDAGSRGGAPRGTRQPAPALAGGGHRRLRFRRVGVLQIRPRTANAGGCEAAGFRQGGAIRRQADHVAPRICGAGRPAGAVAADPAGVAADRRAMASPGGERHGAGRDAGPRAAGMA